MRDYILFITLFSLSAIGFSQDSTIYVTQVQLNNEKIAELKYRLKSLDLPESEKKVKRVKKKENKKDLVPDDSFDLTELEEGVVKEGYNELNSINTSKEFVLQRDTLVITKIDSIEYLLNAQQVQLDRIESYLKALANNQSISVEDGASSNTRNSKDKKKLHDFFERQRVDINEKDSLDNQRWDYFVVVDTYTELNYAKFLQSKIQREYSIKTQLTQSGVGSNLYYLLWTKKITKMEDAIEEVHRLNSLIDTEYLSEGAWLYHKRKY